MSGQVGTDPATGKLVEGGVQKQAEQAIKNIGTILKSVGVTYADVVKLPASWLTFRTSELSTKSTGSISLGNLPDPVLL